MAEKKTYNTGPQYDKRPEIKNYKKESNFKVPRNLVVIGFVGIFIIGFILSFNPFSSIEKDLVDTKWEFTIHAKYQWKNSSPSSTKFFNYVAIEDLNIYSYTYSESEMNNPTYNKENCISCEWSVKGDSIFLNREIKNDLGQHKYFYRYKGIINKNQNIITGSYIDEDPGYWQYYNAEFIARKIED